MDESAGNPTSTEAPKHPVTSAHQRMHAVVRCDVLAGVLVALLAASLAWLRLPPLTRATMWAEDGRVFLWDALFTPPWSTLMQPYDGYYHLLPRAGAEAVSLTMEPAGYALAIAALGCIAAGATAGLVYVFSRAVTDNRLLRVAFAAVTVLVPTLPLEVLGNLANLHWFVLWLTPWMLLYAPRTWAGSVGLGALAVVCALTEIQVAFFLPLFVWRRREIRRWPVRLGLLLGLAVQAFADSPRAPVTAPLPHAEDVVGGYLVNTVLSLWIGPVRTVTAAVVDLGWGVAVIALLPSLAAFLLVLRRGTPVQRVAAVTFPVASVLVWSAAIIINRAQFGYTRPARGSETMFAILRYSPVPSMFLLAGLLLALTVLPRTRTAQVAAAFCALPLVYVAATGFVPGTTSRSDGPVWTSELDSARSACLADPALQFQEFDIAPPRWVARVPCDALEDGG